MIVFFVFLFAFVPSKTVMISLGDDRLVMLEKTETFRRSRSRRIPGAVDTTISGAIAGDLFEVAEEFLAPLQGKHS